MKSIDNEDVVETESCGFALLPKLFVRLWAEESLLAPLAERPGFRVRAGPLLRPDAFSCGTCELPIGVARLNFGGWARGIEGGGTVLSAMGGAAPLFTGR